LRIIRLYMALPKTTEGQVLGKQILRSGTSVGAHYREGQRAKSDLDFINKMERGLQELEERLIGWNYCKKQKSYRKRSYNPSTLKQKNLLLFL